jgi:large subunit ribosomal protein L35
MFVISKKSYTFAPQFLILTKENNMPKMKTNSGAKKRFVLTGSGRIKRKHAYLRHILTKKATKQKRNLSHSGLVHPHDEREIMTLLGK